MKQLQIALLVSLLGLLLPGCIKEQRMTAEAMMRGKNWFLEKKTSAGVNFISNGAATYSFTLNPNGTYTDSDGISGSYSITQQSNTISLTITSTARVITAYTVKHVGTRHLVLEYGTTTTLTRLYFSSRQ
jgi:methyl coenzyme M reductase alpha subunit